MGDQTVESIRDEAQSFLDRYMEIVEVERELRHGLTAATQTLVEVKAEERNRIFRILNDIAWGMRKHPIGFTKDEAMECIPMLRMNISMAWEDEDDDGGER